MNRAGLPWWRRCLNIAATALYLLFVLALVTAVGMMARSILPTFLKNIWGL